MPEIPEESIHVLYSPINDYLQKSNDDSFLLKNKLESKKYFLLLSAGIWQKNSFRMLSAFHNLIKKDQAKEYKVVIIGASQKIKKEFTQNSFIYLDYLDRSDLEVLLKNAHSLVYPSLNEGFGYPPLEAFKYGTGVIASAIGPVLEVCGNAALYFNPYSLTEIELRLLQSINDPDFITETQPRIDRFLMIRQRQINDLNALANLICN
jgi:glycosyltransferase involved in cell wall biosynthesis